MDTKLIYKNKLIWGWEDNKEEAWLRQMANEGLHLVKLVGLGRYAFQAGTPRDTAYRLDFYANAKGDYKQYLQLFQDAGWELVGEFFGWQYFRKSVENGEAPEIFTDNESKIKKYQNLLGVVGGSAPIALICLILLSERTESALSLILAGVMVLIIGFYAFCFTGLLTRINQLKRT